MKNQAFNPYLPSWEYVPDGEPHLFGDRVYVYGSHDRFNAPIFCTEDYVCWSAPKDDLSDWRCEGVIYRKTQDPKNRLGLHLLFAPDVARGADGRFYLYYAFDFMGIISVAVCESPAGHFEFYGYVHYADGTLWGRKQGDQFPFDPAILADTDGRVWLYSGFYTEVPRILTGGKKLRHDGGTVVELQNDMLTIKTAPQVIFPKKGENAFLNHEFFEAASIRHFGSKYIFVYSSRHNHELCYATSDFPNKDFVFGGTLVSLGDIFLNDSDSEQNAVNYLGNTHGGILKIADEYYIFYHRQTNRHSYSRQACAERLTPKSEGGFAQAEITSCGLNAGFLRPSGTYPSYIACNLWSKNGTGRYDCKAPRKAFRAHPYFTQKGKRGRQFIKNMRDGAVAGFKYFDFKTPYSGQIKLELSGKGEGKILLSTKSDFSTINAEISVKMSKKPQNFTKNVQIPSGKHPLFFKYLGRGFVNFYTFTL